MTTHPCIPTRHELDQLRDGTLSAILRPMEPPAVIATIYCGGCEPGWIQWDGFAESDTIRVNEWYRPDDFKLLARKFAPVAAGDVIAWQEEWWPLWCSPAINEVCVQFRSGNNPHVKITHETAVDVCKLLDSLEYSNPPYWQPASTMPAELARYESAVADCRPVQVTKLDWQAMSRLGLESIGHEWYSDFRGRFCVAWPDIPLASWAWWIALKGTQ